MKVYPDTSFLCALYLVQSNSKAAIDCYNGLEKPLYVSALTVGEFKQSIRFQNFINSKDHTQGFSRKLGLVALENLQNNIDSGGIVIKSVDWAEVISIAERISSLYTTHYGHRYLDILHVATAKFFKASTLLTFDNNQKKLALAESLKVMPN